jgi:large subunit ribosomal protein L17e
MKGMKNKRGRRYGSITLHDPLVLCSNSLIFLHTNVSSCWIVTMVRYSVEPEVPEKTAKSRGSHLRVHFKHCREIAHYTSGMNVQKALKILDDVLQFKAIIPFVRFTGGIGRKAMAKQAEAPGDKGRFPVKATAVYRDLLKNALSNAETKGLDTENLFICHAQCNRAPAGRRRTYRAHGRIGKYASQPAHIEIILKEKNVDVEKMPEEERVKITKKMAAKKRFVKIGA